MTKVYDGAADPFKKLMESEEESQSSKRFDVLYDRIEKERLNTHNYVMDQYKIFKSR
jgi:hypothetical protein